MSAVLDVGSLPGAGEKRLTLPLDDSGTLHRGSTYCYAELSPPGPVCPVRRAMTIPTNTNTAPKSCGEASASPNNDHARSVATRGCVRTLTEDKAADRCAKP